jgi:integrase
MRNRDYEKLLSDNIYLMNGGLPDVGKPVGRLGYRFAVGQVVTPSGKVETWRESLGHDLLLAQYRAREMQDVWYCHVDFLITQARAFQPVPIESVEIPPLERAAAKAEAWAEAAKTMAAPAALAREATVALQVGGAGVARGPSPALAPGWKLLAVPDAPAARETIANAPLASGQPCGIHRAAELWYQFLKERFAADDISDDFIIRFESSTLPRIYELIPDKDLNKITKATFDTIRLAFQSKKKSNGQPRGAATVKTELSHVKQLFKWVDEHLSWSAPKGWEKALRPTFHNDDADTDVPDNENDKDVYTIEELTKLFKAAGYSARLWLLSALNFGWGAKEIATARRKHFKTDKPELRKVARFRHKRSGSGKPIPGRWTAWAETWELSIARMAKATTDAIDNPKGLAFLTAQQQPLTRLRKAKSGKLKRVDVIGDELPLLCRAAGVRCRGFYRLRHTGISMIDDIAGEGVADLYSQHSPRSMTRRHYSNGQFRKLRRALRIMRKRLQPLFDAN